MRNHQQNSLVATVGPFNIIDSILGEQFWANVKSSAKYLSGNSGPIQYHRQ
jgi:hypothetical protein